MTTAAKPTKNRPGSAAARFFPLTAVFCSARGGAAGRLGLLFRGRPLREVLIGTCRFARLALASPLS